MNKLIRIILSIFLCISICAMPAYAADSISAKPVIDEYTETHNRTVSRTVNINNTYKTKITLTFAVAKDLSNSSGWRIIGVLDGSASNAGGWVYVSPTITIKSVTYADNCQKASVLVEYYASIGAGTSAYTALITIKL